MNLLLILLALASTVFANEMKYEATIQKSEKFLAWLDTHKTDFAKCTPQKNNTRITLCDGTSFEIKEISPLFKMPPSQLVEFVKKQNIKLEIMCKDDRGTTFKDWCSAKLERKFFKEVTSLHGQYIPSENTIALHSDSNKGSLIHEYLHCLQFQNKNKVYDHLYKKERVEIQNEVVESFDILIAEIQVLEKSKKQTEALALLKYATTFSDILMKFGFWQKLIDERNLFLTFINYSKELGVAGEDIALAEKNMAFLCMDKEIGTLLPTRECDKSN